jgi:hypothetical protein
MPINPLGLTAALTAFLSIWLGHVAVRKIEFTAPKLWLPALLFAAAGLSLEFLSLVTVYRPLSTFFGIFGLTLLWDALELFRQEKRIKRGHAPANPKNPRHALILAQYSAATTVNLLKRPLSTDN